MLQVKKLCKTFGAVTAAENLNVNIDVNSTIGLIGSNGAGKTTFLNMITGYLSPDSGSIFFRDKNITGKPPRYITRQGVYRSFQIPQLFDNMTTEENLEISKSIAASEITINGNQEAKVQSKNQSVKEILEKFQLTEFQNQTASNLPEGTRKLLDIAMALVMGPKLLLLDEPTSGVAAEDKFKIMDMIMNVVETETTAIIFVEHDMEIIKRYTDRTLAFFNGKIIADGATKEVLSHPSVKANVLGLTSQDSKL